MYIKKNFGLLGFLKFSGGHLIWITAWAVIVTSLFEFFHFEWLHIPWLPLSVIGTAVAFYLAELRSLNLIDDFRHMELQKVLNDFYTFQGQAERIKNKKLV